MDPTDLIWMNGEFVAWEDAKVHVLTHGLHYGTGVFDSMRCYDSELGPAVFRNADHIDRLLRSAELYYMPVPYSAEELRAATLELVARNGLSNCYIRPIVNRGYGQMGLNPLEAPVDVTIACWEWGAYLGEEGMRNGIRAKVSSWRRISPDSLIPHAKASGQYLNSVLAKVESVKAVSDLFSPVSGTVAAVNDSLKDKPETINTDANTTWLLKITLSDATQVDGLLTAADYEKFISEETGH